MRSLFIALCLLLLGNNVASAQTTALNFTATDCNAVSHTLFNELDNGKVVVLVWVMPCSVCISDAKGAYDAVQSFAASHPGKVLYYLVDDEGNTNCTDVSAWAATNGIGPSNVAVFDNTGMAIDQTYYISAGMPHVVVVGGLSHSVYLNILSGSNNMMAIQGAISRALSPAGIAPTGITAGDVKLYPNPASDHISVDYSLLQAGSVSLDVFDMQGTKVQTLSENRQAGKQSVQMKFDPALSNGFYLLRLNAGGSSRMLGFTIAH